MHYCRVIELSVMHYCRVVCGVQNYVHRSGRTARALNEGLSVMFVSPDDLPNYRKIIKALNRGMINTSSLAWFWSGAA